ncbi:hypothetical protein ABER98_10860 [Domibacillus aminovorans]|uniref:hypothetical protein n=1 Tax=Domibacillus aminovorans TaxID=29332 RepID=UPI003D217664
MTITNDHGWTLEQLKAYEKKIKKASMVKRVTMILLIMEGYYAMEISKLLHVHQDTIST